MEFGSLGELNYYGRGYFPRTFARSRIRIPLILSTHWKLVIIKKIDLSRLTGIKDETTNT